VNGHNLRRDSSLLKAGSSISFTGSVVASSSEIVWSEWIDLVHAAQVHAGAPVTAAAAVAVPSGIPAAVRETGEVMEVAGWFDQPPGLYRIDDMLVEYQLTRVGKARQRLAALLDPVEAHPELLRTLTTYLGFELNRRRTANLLHVHPNTVDYRLRRTAELTGIDLLNPVGIQRAAAAVAARRAEYAK
jgi:sugar diacid utilization regulator